MPSHSNSWMSRRYSERHHHRRLRDDDVVVEQVAPGPVEARARDEAVRDDVDQAAEGRDQQDRPDDRPADRPVVGDVQQRERRGARQDRDERGAAREAPPLGGERLALSVALSGSRSPRVHGHRHAKGTARRASDRDILSGAERPEPDVARAASIFGDPAASCAGCGASNPSSPPHFGHDPSRRRPSAIARLCHSNWQPRQWTAGAGIVTLHTIIVGTKWRMCTIDQTSSSVRRPQGRLPSRDRVPRPPPRVSRSQWSLSRRRTRRSSPRASTSRGSAAGRSRSRWTTAGACPGRSGSATRCSARCRARARSWWPCPAAPGSRRSARPARSRISLEPALKRYRLVVLDQRGTGHVRAR